MDVRGLTRPAGAWRPATAALAAVALLAATPPVTAAAATERSSTLERARALAAEVEPEAEEHDDGSSRHSWQDRLCASDPAGDTFWQRETDGETEDVYEEFPPADIRSFCGDYAATLALELQLAEADDPATDPSWAGETGAFWFIDANGDGDFEYVAIYERDGDEVIVDVLFMPQGGPDEVACTAEPAFDAATRTLRAEGIPADCVGAPDRVLVAPVMVYDSDAADTDAPIFLDIADHSVGVGRSGRPELRDTRRLAGDTRFTTAVAISRERYPSSGDAPGGVYLARADLFADALAAGALSSSASTDGPILLVPSCGAVPIPVLEEITRLDPARVTALGGEQAVCDDTLHEAAGGTDDGGRTTARLQLGEEPTRFGTAVAISRRAFANGAEVAYLATGLQFPDALSAGSLEDGPVLLVPTCGTLPEVVAEELSRLGAEAVVALGGQSAVCAELLESARTAGGADRDAWRLAGATRFETAVAVSGEAFPEGAPVVYVVRADRFADALAGGVLVGGPILLVPACGDLPGVIGDEIRRLAPHEVVALGGEAAVCAQMLRHAANA